MALSNYEKQKRWRAKHRALYNLQQRNRRKKGGDVKCDAHVLNRGVEPENRNAQFIQHASEAAPEVGSLGAAFETKKVGEFRMLVMPEEVKEESTMPVVKRKVFFNDHGAQISESVWSELQEKKRIAKENGYEFDPQ